MTRILAINPGATSTKVGLYENGTKVFTETVRHYKEDIQKFAKTIDQLDMRTSLIKAFLDEKGVSTDSIDIFVARGGPFKAMHSGTYEINGSMIDDVISGRVLADHVSNLACLIADRLASNGQKKYIVDPVSVDEFDEVARVSGMKEIERKSLSHALNMKMIAKRWAKENGKAYNDSNLILVHLGTGISVSAHCKGRMIDVNNANDEGPFSPQRCGGLPATQLAKYSVSKGLTYDDLKRKLTVQGGLYSYFETDNVPEIIEKSAGGDSYASLVLDAMMYQVCKEIGAMSTVLKGKVDAIIVTGGIAYNKVLTDVIIERTSFISEIFIYPGEDEIEALVEGVLRIVNNEEKPMEY